MNSSRGGVALLGLIAVLGCSTQGADPDEPAAPVVSEAGPSERPMSLADIAPGDTVAIVRLMEALMTDGNSVLDQSVRRDTAVAASLPDQPRTLSLWLYADRPVKLVASEADADGRMIAETRVWFHGGEVSVVQEPFAVHLFDGDRLVLSTDEGMMPLEPTDDVRMRLERSVIDSVKARLVPFGITYP